jgi:hypothetical protein
MGIAVIAPSSALRDGDGKGAFFLDGVLHFGRDGLQGFLPGDPLPLAFTLLPGPLEGVFEPERIIDMLYTGQTLGTHRTFGQRIRVAFDMDNNAILHCYFNPASAMAAFAGGLNYFSFTHGTSKRQIRN